MPDIIRLLPDSVANKIAAGEVIQRPSSVIKELVENSADAGATEINIVIRDAGRTLIQVTDNGKGMSPTDARMAFERHATSKIREAEDLFSLQTMGFRGEALPSICAIAQVELRSAIEGEQIGTRLLINGSVVSRQEPYVCAKGTTIMVKNIFFNVPARRRFLKSDNVELSNIYREFERLALVNPGIRFKIDTGTRTREFRAGSFKQRITDLWKGLLNPELIPVKVDTQIVKIDGFITRPEHARRRNALQYLTANGRCMQHPYFQRAIAGCYERLIAPDTKPCYFLNFTVNPAEIDVNIHPSKKEVKFEQEQEIYKLLVSAVHAALGQYSVVPSIDFSSNILEVTPPGQDEKIMPPPAASDPHYNPFKSHGGDATWQQKVSHSDWEALYRGFENASPGYEGHPVLPFGSDFDSEVKKGQFGKQLININQVISQTDSLSSLAPICLQIDQSFIVAPCREGLMIIDQHRAHVNVLFHQLMNQSRDVETAVPLQGILFGETLSLDSHQMSVLEEALPHLKRMGITLKRENDEWTIKSMPSILSSAEGKDIILQTLDALQNDNEQYGSPVSTAEDMRRKVALSLARSSAVRRGKQLSVSEMEHLLSDLLKLPNPDKAPDGNKIIYLLDIKHISSFF